MSSLFSLIYKGPQLGGSRLYHTVGVKMWYSTAMLYVLRGPRENDLSLIARPVLPVKVASFIFRVT